MEILKLARKIEQYEISATGNSNSIEVTLEIANKLVELKDNNPFPFLVSSEL